MSRARGRESYESMVCGATYELRKRVELTTQRSKVAGVGARVVARCPANGFAGDRDWICDIVGKGGNVVGHVTTAPWNLRRVSALELLAALTALPSASGSSSAAPRPPGADPR